LPQALSASRSRQTHILVFSKSLPSELRVRAD
jgi:hypothetical protein